MDFLNNCFGLDGLLIDFLRLVHAIYRYRYTHIYIYIETKKKTITKVHNTEANDEMNDEYTLQTVQNEMINPSFHKYFLIILSTLFNT